MATWNDVRELASSLPAVEEGTIYRRPAFRVAGKTFAWMSPHEQGALVVRVDPGELPLLIDSRPEVFFTTGHYAGYPMMLVRLEAADRAVLGELIEDSWLLAAPRKLVDAYAAEQRRG